MAARTAIKPSTRHVEGAQRRAGDGRQRERTLPFMGHSRNVRGGWWVGRLWWGRGDETLGPSHRQQGSQWGTVETPVGYSKLSAFLLSILFPIFIYSFFQSHIFWEHLLCAKYCK